MICHAFVTFSLCGLWAAVYVVTNDWDCSRPWTQSYNRGPWGEGERERERETEREMFLAHSCGE